MSETKELTLNDIATKVCDYYREIKEGSTEKTSALFLQAIERYYNGWAKERDYTIKEFKSTISKIIQRRRKGYPDIPMMTPEQKDQMEACSTLNKKPISAEGDGFSFLFNQIKRFSLNVDSYY